MSELVIGNDQKFWTYKMHFFLYHSLRFLRPQNFGAGWNGGHIGFFCIADRRTAAYI